MRSTTAFRSLFPLALGLLASACTSRTESAPEATNVGEQTARAYLDPSSYAGQLRLAPSFPFGVTRKHAAAGGVLGASWGRHGGPVVTSSGTGAAGRAKVARWSVGGAATSTATSAELPVVAAPNVPAQRFWNADGIVDLPFGDLAMHAYTTSSSAFAGEVLFYGRDYASVAGRAYVNGFYAGVGLTKGDARRVVYSGLSSLASSTTSANESGLYAADVCGASAVPSAACAPRRLFGWTGSSGPVAKDRAGNVFVAAFTPGGAQSDVVFAVSNEQAMAAAAVKPATVATLATNGTASLAAALPSDSATGWVFGKGYDGEATAPVWARRYTANGAVGATGEVIANAIQTADPLASMSLFSDDGGHLWVALESNDGNWLFQFEPKQ